MEQIHTPIHTLEAHTPSEYEFLNEYEGYDNPDLIADLRVSVIEATRGKNKTEARRIRSQLISRYLRNHLDTDSLDDDEEARDLYEDARDEVRYWLSVDIHDWEGDVDEHGNYVGNGIYDELARDAYEVFTAEEANTTATTVEVERSILDRLTDATTSVQYARESYAARLAKAGQKIKSVEKDIDLAITQEEWQNSLTEFARVYTEKAMAEKPEGVSAEEWREVIKAGLLQGMTAEFKLLEEAKVAKLEDSRMNKIVSWFNRGGKLKRMGKGMVVGVIVGAATLPLGLAGGVIGAGGIVTAGALGLSRFAKGFAGWHGRKPSAKDLMSDDMTSYNERLNTFVAGSTDYDAIDTEEAVRRASTVAADKEKMRTVETKKALRSSLAVGALAAGVGAGVTLGIHALDAKLGVKDWVADRFSSKPKASISPNAHQPNSGVMAPVEQTPSIPTHEVVQPPTTPPVDAVPASMPTAEQFANLDRLVHAEGQYPWSRAVEFFGGDEHAATEWIKQNAAKAGATWHNEGTVNAWIEIDGRSDTDYVWSKLVEASLQP